MRKLFLFFLLIPFFSIAQMLEGQKLIDSLLVELPKMKEDTLKVKIFITLSNEFQYKNNQISYMYAEKTLRLATKLNYKFGITNAYKTFGNYYILKREYENGLKNYRKGLNSANSSQLKAKMYMGISVAHFYQSDYPKAIEYNFLALKEFELANDTVNQLKTLRNIGMNYLQIDQYKNAIKIYNKCLKLNKTIQLSGIDCALYLEIGICYFHLNQFELTKKYLNITLNLCKDDEVIVGNSYSTLAGIYFREKKFKSALNLYNKSIAIFKKTDDVRNFNSILSNTCFCNFELYKLEKNLKLKNQFLNNTISIAKQNLKSGKDILELTIISELHKTLSEAQKLQGNYKESLESHKQYVIYKDSVFNSENKETIKNLEDKREIELRDKQIKINKLSLEAKEKQKWLFVAGIGFMAIIGGLLFYQNRKRKLTNQKLETLNQTLDQNNLKLETLNKDLDQANKAKTRFFGILNHDLRGPVSNLVIFLQLQQEAPEMLDEESTKRMQDKTMTGAKNLLASMEDILQWSKSQMENFKPQPKNVSINQLFDDTKKVFSGYLNIRIEYQNPDNIEIFTDDNYLKTIIRNLTSNAINVLAEFVSSSAVERQIIWKAWQENRISYLSITDNGPGANPEKLKALFEESELGTTKSGLGLHLIRDMAKAIDCEISVESTIGVGTTFVLTIK